MIGGSFIEVNLNSNSNTSIKTNIKSRNLSVRAVLNIIGVFIFIGLLLTTLSTTIPANQGMEYYQTGEHMMKHYKIIEFSLFVLASGVIYFFLVNIYYMSQKLRRIFYLTLLLLLAINVYMVYREIFSI